MNLNDFTYFLIEALNVYSYLLILRMLISWIPVDTSSRLIQILIQVTDIVLDPLRKFIPSFHGIDLSIMVALLGLYLIKYLLLRSLA